MDDTTREKLEREVQYRDFEIRAESVDKEARTVEIAFSSETPVIRWYGIEILSHDPGAVRLDRLNRGGALLVDHDRTDHVGVLSNVRVDADKKARTLARFGKSARAEEVFQDVIDGIRVNVSNGYQVYRFEEMDPKTMSKELLELSSTQGLKVYRAVDWEPVEVSLVSIPADVSVGVGRAHEPQQTHNQPGVRTMNNIEAPPAQGQAIDSEQIRIKAERDARESVGEIYALAERFASKVPKINEIRDKAITDRWTVDEFRREVLNKMATTPAVDTKTDDARMGDIGMSTKEVKQYSLVRALNTLADGKTLDGLEREASDALATKIKRSAKGFFIAPDAMRAAFIGSLPEELAGMLARYGVSPYHRDLGTANSTKGGFTVGTDVLAGSMIELLRNRPLLAQMGVRSLTGLTGNVAIPKQSGGATAYWLADDGTSVTKSDQAFGQAALVPHKLAADTAYSKELLIQSSIDVEAFVREDLMTVLAIEKDRAGINGLGAAGEPLGILNTTGLSTAVTFGAAATWAKVLEFETNISGNNADVAGMGYLTTPAVRGKWKGITKVANTAEFLWANDMVNGYKTGVTKQVPSDKVIFANFLDALFGDWAGIDVVVDPYSLKKSGQIEVTIQLLTDFVLRHPVSFCVSADSGAQ